MAYHEMQILSIHLKHNLWGYLKFGIGQEEMSIICLHEDVSIELDIAMMARRCGVNGNKSPPGYTSTLNSSSFGRLLSQIEKFDDEKILNFFLLLLTFPEKEVKKISNALNTIFALCSKDNKNHNFVLPLIDENSGIIVHCNNDIFEQAYDFLMDHSRTQKYSNKAGSW